MESVLRHGFVSVADDLEGKRKSNNLPSLYSPVFSCLWRSESLLSMESPSWINAFITLSYILFSPIDATILCFLHFFLYTVLLCSSLTLFPSK